MIGSREVEKLWSGEVTTRTSSLHNFVTHQAPHLLYYNSQNVPFCNPALSAAGSLKFGVLRGQTVHFELLVSG